MKGSFHINYNGDEGITVKAGQASASPGSLSGDGKLGQLLSVSIAPHAILVGMAAPKITLSLGTESVTDLLNEAMPSSLADTLSDILSKTGAGKWAKKKLDKSFKTEASANVQNVAVATVTAQGSAGMVIGSSLVGSSGVPGCFISCTIAFPLEVTRKETHP